MVVDCNLKRVGNERIIIHKVTIIGFKWLIHRIEIKGLLEEVNNYLPEQAHQ